MIANYYNQLNGNIDNDVSLFSGGLNMYNEKAFIDTNQMSYVLNMTMERPPLMQTRAPREHIFLLDLLAPNSIIESMWAWDEHHIFVITKGKASISTRKLIFGEWTSQNGWNFYEPVEEQAHLPIGTEPLYFCYCKTATEQYLYIGNSGYKAKITLNPNAETMWQSFDEIDDNHYGIPVWHKGRMFFTNTNSNIITYSALYDYDNFTEVPADPDPDIDYSSYAGDFFVTNAVGKVTRTVSFDDKLVIFCEHSMHILYGDTPLINSSSQFQLVDLNNNLGCCNPLSIAIGGGYLFWVGDDKNIYSFSGASMDIINRPVSSRYVSRLGGISLSYFKYYESITQTPYLAVQGVATSQKYYLQLLFDDWTEHVHDDDQNTVLFVYDIKNRLWWAEEGKLTALANLRNDSDDIVMATTREEVLQTKNDYIINGGGYDRLYNTETDEVESVPIKYEFHTKVFGADGLDSRKSLSEVWFQASANADVFLTDSWTSSDKWGRAHDNECDKKIGELHTKGWKDISDSNYLKTYDSDDYEQQVCYAQKMYGQRVNTFQVKVRGEGNAKFFLMKRKWDAR